MTSGTGLYAELIILDTEAEYRDYYKIEYCDKQITTHDGMVVTFRPEDFDHAFFKNASRRRKDKSIFATERAQRMSWIKKVLQDKNLTLYAGWDSKRKRYDHTRRVCLVTDDGYVVVLRIVNATKAVFNTAYLIDDPEVERKIKSSPVWELKL